MKVRMVIYNMKGKLSIWWQDLKLAKGLKEKQIEWSNFKKQYISEITMKEKTNNFMSYNLVKWLWRI